MSVSSIVKIKHLNGIAMFDIESVIFIKKNNEPSITVHFFSNSFNGPSLTMYFDCDEDAIVEFNDLYTKWKTVNDNRKQALVFQE